MPLLPYEALEVRGSWLTDRHFLLDNTIVESRLGYYALTPFETGVDEPLLHRQPRLCRSGRKR